MKEMEILRVIEEYDEMIHRVLKRCGVKKVHSDYDDLYQELRIEFLRILAGVPTTEKFEDLYPRGCLYNRLVWFCIDYQRKAWLSQQQEILYSKNTEVGDQIDNLADIAADFESDVLLVDEFREILRGLSETERNILRLLVKDAEKPCLKRRVRSYYRNRLWRIFSVIKRK